MLFAAARPAGIVAGETAELLVMVVTISMLLAPLSFIVHDRLLRRWLERTSPRVRHHRRPGNPVIIAGYGRYGQIVSRVLRMCGMAFTALEVNYQQVDFVRRFGNKVYYGDASRLELLQSARAGEAKLFVLAIDDVEASVKTAAVVRKNFPESAHTCAGAQPRALLPPAGPRHRRRPSSANLSVEPGNGAPGVGVNGNGADAAARAVALFKEHDEKLMDEQYAVRQDEAQLIQTAEEAAAQLREVFDADVQESGSPVSGPNGEAINNYIDRKA